MLEVRHLAVAYGGTPVVTDVSFELATGEILMLVGPTGCGKTTILRALAGLVPPSAGEIRIGARRIDPGHPVPPEKLGVGMVFQDFALFPHLNVAQNIGFRLHDLEPGQRWIERLGLQGLQDAMPENLSGGQKQRVAPARALAHEPSLMLLDEPLSNLDAALKDTLRWEIRDALRVAELPAVWVTHDQAEALSVGDRVGILNDGQLEQLDSPERCFCLPRTRLVARFLGEGTFLPGHLAQGEVRTRLGSAPGAAVNGASGDVDLLVRPDDVSLQPAAAQQGNGHIESVSYEGGSRLYGVRLEDGTRLMVRVSHEIRLQAGDRVQLALSSTHPLAAFDRGAAPVGGLTS